MKGKIILVSISLINSLIGNSQNVYKKIQEARQSLNVKDSQLKFTKSPNIKKYSHVSAKKIVMSDDQVKTQVKTEEYEKKESINNKVRKARERAARASAKRLKKNPESKNQWKGLKQEYSLKREQLRNKKPETTGYSFVQEEINDIKQLQ